MSEVVRRFGFGAFLHRRRELADTREKVARASRALDAALKVTSTPPLSAQALEDELTGEHRLYDVHESE
jgi:hypothetical protein